MIILHSSSQKNLSAIEMKQTQILMNKPVFLGLSVLELTKILMYDEKYDKKAKRVIRIETTSLYT